MAADDTTDPTWDRWEGASAPTPDPLDAVAPAVRPSLPPPPPPSAAPYPTAPDPTALHPPQPYSPPTSVYNRMDGVPFIAVRPPRRRSPWPYVAVAALLVGGGLFALPRLRGDDAGSSRTGPPVVVPTGDVGAPDGASVHLVQTDAVRFALPGNPEVDHDPLEAVGVSIPQTVWTYEKDETTLVVIVQTYPEALDDRTVLGAFDGAVGGIRREFGDAVPMVDITSTDDGGRPTRHVGLTGEGQNVSM